MKTIHAAIAIGAGLICALWWGVQPPRALPRIEPLVQPVVEPQRQCPANSRLEGKLCVCPQGTQWKEAACVKAWSGAPQQAAPPAAGTMARMERMVGDFRGAGNIAIVEAADATSITIIEGDARTGAMTRRSASGSDAADAARKLGIVAYIK